MNLEELKSLFEADPWKVLKIVNLALDVAFENDHLLLGAVSAQSEGGREQRRIQEAAAATQISRVALKFAFRDLGV